MKRVIATVTEEPLKGLVAGMVALYETPAGLELCRTYESGLKITDLSLCERRVEQLLVRAYPNGTTVSLQVTKDCVDAIKEMCVHLKVTLEWQQDSKESLSFDSNWS